MNCIQCGFQQLSIKTLSLQQPVARGGPGSCRRDPYYYGGNDRDFIEIKVSLVLLKTEKMLESQFEFPSFEKSCKAGQAKSLCQLPKFCPHQDSPTTNIFLSCPHLCQHQDSTKRIIYDPLLSAFVFIVICSSFMFI